ncbi:OsmC family protein [Yoonia sediminilitoris]|uniref:OsmC-like protein n=1 Tax=Yoonia sediminilitoris TaxID=1286148 RepID=A0A2T6K180_9RHOB|nr:OsmC family protein [Yoonia sediminilitoris]PUB08375.1 OsmC-like protein [Yoonia sediminilitoris]RCW89431.1 OsmC-like protein [Yoonia sediminilitoris]
MDRNSHAREAQLRAISIFTQRPEHAQVVNRGFAKVRDGLSCTYEQDGHSLTLDMPNAIGGSEEGPTPGFFARAAICGCLAIGIKMTAARENLELDSVSVGIEQDWDNRGVLAMAGASPVPGDTRIAIEIKSPEPEDEVGGMVSRAIANDPWFLAYRDAQPVSTVISIVQGAL